MTNTLLENLLEHSLKTKSLIGIRNYNDGDDLWVGYVVGFDNSFVVMQHISKLGLEDGLLIQRIENIESFEQNTAYINTYQSLLDSKTSVGKQTIKNIKLPKSENWQYEVLMGLFGKGKIISIELYGDDGPIHGFILGCDETYLRYKPITDVGNDEGECIYKLADIKYVTADRLESRKRETFYKLKNKN